jgi:hypothetical protein
MSSDMETGEGRTNVWYIGGLQPNSSLSIFLCNSDSSKDEHK